MLAKLSRPLTLLLLPIFLLISGCFVEEDTISIGKNGVLSFESVVTVQDADMKFDFDQVDQIAAQSVEQLKNAKWKVERTWLSKERPFKMKISGSGQLNDVGNTTPFYSLNKEAEKRFAIAFLTVESEGKSSRRSIVFKKPEGGAEIFEMDGKTPVTKIDSVAKQRTYIIKLP